MLRLAAVLIATMSFVGLAGPTHAAEDYALQPNVNHVWVITATALVLLMQCGFMLLEAGNVRTKNTVNVAQKNLVDFLVSALCFGLVGFALMFGTSQFGWFGWDAELLAFGASEPWTITFFVFQLVFCGTAATIVSGAVAERMSLGGYIACTALIALIIYPIAGHWSWGGQLQSETEPFLAARGFMDFAGGTVVHAVGAAVGLAAIIQLGPRNGRFDEDGNPIKIRGHSPVLATVGTFFIWVGWIGFNGGSTTSGTGDIAQIIYVTMIGGAVGGVVGMGLGRFTDQHWVPNASINGTLAGLVGVTAGANVLDGKTAVLVAAIAAGIVFYVERWILERCKLDDPLGAVAVHGAAGIFGTLVIPFVAPIEALATGDRMSQAVIQLMGVSITMLWAFGVSYVGLRIVDSVLRGPDGSGLRVPRSHEDQGLNATEHDAPLGTGLLEVALFNLARGTNGSFEPIILERGDEAYEMSVLVNELMENLHRTIQDVEAAVYLASQGDFSKRLSLEGRDGTSLELCKGMNQINEVCEAALYHIQARLSLLAEGNLVFDINADLNGQFQLIADALEGSASGLRGMVEAVQTSANAVITASHAVSGHNRTIAEQAEMQAQSVERAKVNIEELNTSSKDTMSFATNAAAKNAEALTFVKRGRDAAATENSRMQNVTAMAANIAKAVDQINLIVKQIDILAINAAVEAEHAQNGTGGSKAAGFAVVASEVRQLAERTRRFAEDIKRQSLEVNTAAAESSDLVDDVSRQIDVLHASIEASAGLADHVAAAGQSLLTNVHSVGEAISEVKQGSEATIRCIAESEHATGQVFREAERTQELMAAFETTRDGGPLEKAA